MNITPREWDRFGLPILPMPKNTKSPKPPEPPPGREFTKTFWRGLIIETNESKQKRLNYQHYIRGWRDAMEINHV